MGMSRCFWYQMSGWSSGLWFERNTWWNYFHSKIVRMFTSTPHDSQVTSNPRNHGSWHLNTLTTLIHLIHILNTFLGHINLQNTTIFAACGVNYLSKLMAFRTIYLPWISPNTNNQTKPLNGLGTSGLAKELNCKLGFASNHSRWNPGCREPSEAHSSRPSPQIWRTKTVTPSWMENPANQVSPSKNLPPPFFFIFGVSTSCKKQIEQDLEHSWVCGENIVWTKEPLPKNIHHMSQKFYINKDLDLFWFSSPAFHFRTKLPPSDLRTWRVADTIAHFSEQIAK